MAAENQKEFMMKKIVAMLLIALVVMTSAFAEFKVKSVGLETGEGYFVSVAAEAAENLDVYGRLGYADYFGFSVGANYKLAELHIDNKTVFDVAPGAQLTLGFRDSLFVLGFLFNCQLSFDNGQFGAFVRPALGLLHQSYKGNGNTDFNLCIETGVYYLF